MGRAAQARLEADDQEHRHAVRLSALERPSPHFTWREFACHDGTPCPAFAHDDVRRLCRHFLEPLRRRFGPVHVISGFRTAAYNHEVGGAPQSYHMYLQARRGAAADVACRSGTPRQWADFLDSMDAPGLGRYSQHVHVDNRAYRARW